MTPKTRKTLGAVAIAFGALTVVAGFSVLFGGPTVGAMAGRVVTGILWFNALSGVVYIGAGLCIWRNGPYGRMLALGLALAIGLAFAALGLHIAQGGAYEMRTIAAMTFRFVFWASLALLLPRRTPA